MALNFPPPPRFEGLTYLSVQPVIFADRRVSRHDVFPVYYYREDATGELVLVAEDRHEKTLDKLIAMGAFGPKGGWV